MLKSRVFEPIGCLACLPIPQTNKQTNKII